MKKATIKMLLLYIAILIAIVLVQWYRIQQLETLYYTLIFKR